MFKNLLKVIIGLLSKSMNYENFRFDLKQRESSNNYKSVNSLGYLGAYQFGMARLSDFGLTKRIEGTTSMENKDFEWSNGYSKDIFLNDDCLQDNIFDKHIDNLILQLKNLSLLKYIDFTIGGVKITLSGLLAGCHLGGIGSVKTFLLTGLSKKDNYETSIIEYIKQFSGYDIYNK